MYLFITDLCTFNVTYFLIPGHVPDVTSVIYRYRLADRKRQVHITIFGFNGQTTIASYIPKKNRSVIMLFTMHHDKKVEPQMDNKPDIILDYNKTKGAVDTLDKLCCQYSTKHGTRRWPLSMFFTLLDICLITTARWFGLTNILTGTSIRQAEEVM